jgi:tetratricopeptide (TPR) repeat protein/transcriptional regulator with XRE-family HTH domain
MRGQVPGSQHAGPPLHLLPGSAENEKGHLVGAPTFDTPCRIRGKDGWREDVSVVAGDPELSFAALLRQLRTEARLTQEELAETAGISARAVSDLERGVNRTAHKDTAQLLAAAFGLSGPTEERFVAAARGRAPVGMVVRGGPGAEHGTSATAAATRALPRDIASFTGRQDELARLLQSIHSLTPSGGVVGIYAIDGMAGIGKTTLAVHAAHYLADAFPDGQFFLPLHAHTPRQRPVDPSDALVSLLLTAGLTPQLIPAGLEARAARWRNQVAGKKILLLLDDAASHEQVQPLLPGTAGSLVLITSRRRLAALHDATVISLDTLPADEAATLLVRLASRADIDARDAAVGKIAGLCGYLPLAIGMLAARLRHHPAWTPAQLAATLAQGRDQLTVMQAENVSVAAAFDLSYQDLPPGPQRLFRRLGLVPGPSIDAYAAAALDGISLPEARQQLNDLYDQHLVTESAPGRYELHDLLRAHAADLAHRVDDESARREAVHRLLDHYLHTAHSGSLVLNPVRSYITLTPAAPGAIPQSFTSRSETLTWFAAERQVLIAAIAQAGELGFDRHAWQLPWAAWLFFDRQGYWHDQVAIQRTAMAAAQRLGDLVAQAHIYRDLGTTYSRLGFLSRAHRYCTRALDLYREAGDRLGEARAHNEIAAIAIQQRRPAEALDHAQRSLDLFRHEDYAPGVAKMLNGVGYMLAQQGQYEHAFVYCEQGLAMYRELASDPLNEAAAWDSVGYVLLNLGRYDEAISALRTALDLIEELQLGYYQTTMLIHLGDAYHAAGVPTRARNAWQKALDILEDLKHSDAELVRARLVGGAPTARSVASAGETDPLAWAAQERAVHWH